MTPLNFRRRDTRGAALVEYGLLVGLVAVVAIGSVSRMGVEVRDTFGMIAFEMSGAIEGSTVAGGSGSGSGAGEEAGGAAAGPQGTPVAPSAKGIIAPPPGHPSSIEAVWGEAYYNQRINGPLRERLPGHPYEQQAMNALCVDMGLEPYATSWTWTPKNATSTGSSTISGALGMSHDDTPEAFNWKRSSVSYGDSDVPVLTALSCGPAA